jgi:DNA-binding LacI/PurR family transcriptional regulator
VRQPARKIGMEAAKLLFRRLAQRGFATPQRIVLEPTLVVRESCGAAMK